MGQTTRMLSPDCQFDQIDQRHWHNGLRLLLPPRAVASPTVALAIVDGTPPRLLRALVLGRRNVDDNTIANATLASVNGPALEQFARSLGAGVAIAIDSSLLTTLSAAVEPRLRFDQPLVEQGLLLWNALRAHLGRGVWTWPDLLPLLPNPPHHALARTFDRLIPDDTCLAAYIVDDHRKSLHASIIAHKRDGQVVRVTTHLALADLVDERELAQNFERKAGELSRAIASRVAKPSVLLMTTTSTLRQVITGPGDQLARELTAGRVLLDPAPAWLRGLLGGAAVAAVAGRGARALASFLPTALRDQARGVAERARTAAKDAGADPFALLGFDPLAVWAELRHLYRA